LPIAKLKTNGRIVSFLPSSTEILYEIGAGDQITGVTHECNYPVMASNKPRVVKSSFDATKMTSKEIDDKIASLMKSGEDIYIIDDQKLKESKPDLIIAQGVCEVCAPFTKEIERSKSILGYKPDLLVLDPHDLEDILVSIIQIADRIGRLEEGHRLVDSLQNRIDVVKRIVEAKTSTANTNTHASNDSDEEINKAKPMIVCLEWIEPFFIAGHWVPQMVEIAGGVNGLNAPRQRSRRISIEEVIEFNPHKIVLMPCGFDIDRTLRELKVLQNNDNWKSLAAVKSNEVYAVNANAYFSKPGPRTITGLEILAKILHPDEVDIKVPTNSFRKVTIN
jgi:iron complex transport system substrate-binding protein